MKVLMNKTKGQFVFVFVCDICYFEKKENEMFFFRKRSSFAGFVFVVAFILLNYATRVKCAV